jgi:hypothetical protein
MKSWARGLIWSLLALGGRAAAVVREDELPGATPGVGEDEEYMQVANSTRLIISSPQEGAVVGENPDVFVSLVTEDTDRFSRAFKDAKVCLSLDDLPFACWPVGYARMRVAELPDGPHKVGSVR